MKILYTIIFLTVFTVTSFAQNTCNCCTPEHNQFDFWKGSWVVKNPSGTTVGHNKIFKIEANCVLSEEWKSTSGGTGRSYNYYNPKDNTWNQLWLDSSGTILKLKGKLIDGIMILKSDLLPNKNNTLYYNKISWKPNKDGTVTQTWETYNEKNILIATLFKGIYHKTPH